MKNNISQKRKDDFEKDMNTVWKQASNATLLMTLGSLGSFLAVFLIVFFVMRDRLEAEAVIPSALFASLLIMLVIQLILRRILMQKRKTTHA